MSEEIKPDMATKFSKMLAEDPTPIGAAQSENVSTIQKMIPVTQDDIRALDEMCEQIAPDTAGQPLAQRMAVCLNTAFAKGHTTAAGIMPVYDRTDPSQPAGYIHAQFGFYASKFALESASEAAYNAGLDAGEQCAIARKDASMTWEQRGDLVWSGFKGISAWIILVGAGIVGLAHMVPLGGH